MERELRIALQLAVEAGRVVLHHFRGEFEVEEKPHDGPVTAADREADALIRAGLAREFPGDAVLSEEFPDDLSRVGTDRLWLVDPLDGTRQFVDGLGEFAVMIGLAVAGRAALGVVHLPADRITVAGAPGYGVRLFRGSDAPLAIEIEPLPADPDRITIAISRNSAGNSTRRVCQELGARRLVQSGSVGRKALLVVTGEADAYVTMSGRSRHWDSCAAEAVVRLAGGEFLDADGGRLRYNTVETRNRRGLMAARAGLIGPLTRAVRRARDEHGPRC